MLDVCWIFVRSFVTDSARFQLMSASCRRSILPTPLWYATLFFFLSRGELCKARKEYASYGREKPIRKNKNAGRSRKGNGTSRAGEWDRPVPLGAVKCYFLNGRPTAALSLPSLAYRLAQGEPMNRPLGCSLNGVLQLRTAPVADSISTSRGPARSARSMESHQAFLYLTAPLITPPTTHFWAKM